MRSMCCAYGYGLGPESGLQGKCWYDRPEISEIVWLPARKCWQWKIISGKKGARETHGRRYGLLTHLSKKTTTSHLCQDSFQIPSNHQLIAGYTTVEGPSRMGEMLEGTVVGSLALVQDKDAPALIVAGGGPQLTHAELAAEVAALGAQLVQAGAKPGDLISMAFPNTLEFVVAFLAVARIRSVAAPLNAAYTEDEFRFYMEDAQAKLLLVPSEGNTAAESAAASLSIPNATVSSSQGGAKLSLTPKPPLTLSTPPPAALPTPSPSDEALFLHTSGTTSRPKGVPLSHGNLAASLGNIIGTYELGPSDRTVVVMPLFHVHGLMAALLATLAAGGAAILPAGGRFSAGAFWGDMLQHRASWYTAVPTIHQILLARHRSDPLKASDRPPLRFIRSCSAALAPAVLQELEGAFGAPVLEAYAMTEAAHQMCSNPLPHHGPHKPGSVGKPTGIQLAILDDANQPLPAGTVGEICIKGPNVTAGYKDNPAANEAAFAGGWFHTGDRGVLNADGYLSLTGRIKELINRGGEKINPNEVDAALLSHPAVSEGVAFSAPDEKYGEVVNAAVALHEGQSATEKDIQEHVKQRLSAFKVPVRVFFTDKVPRTATGKIQRRKVAEHFLKGPEDAAEGARTDKPPPSGASCTRQGAGEKATPQEEGAEETIDGMALCARALAKLGVKYMFGVVGIPVTALATYAQQAGIRFIGFRNEQAAGYAATAAGYLTGLPAALLTVSGPGAVHGLAGLSNGMANCWPVVMISGSCPTEEVGRGGFQELDQMEAVRPFVKFAGKAEEISQVPEVVAKAVAAAISQRPGGAYVDLPADVIRQRIRVKEAEELLGACMSVAPWFGPGGAKQLLKAPEDKLQEAVSLLRNAKAPLLVFGKGAAYARAEKALAQFVDVTGVPFVATPMAKGVLPDSHPLSAAAARSLALGGADVVLVVGARINWLLHFGDPPRWSKDVKFIQLDVSEEELELRSPAVALLGDAMAVMEQINGAVKDTPFCLGKDHPWVAALQAKARANAQKMAVTLAKDVVPMDFNCSMRTVRDALAKIQPPPILVSEGANTMDVGRSVLEQTSPRTRLDAGTWGTMGVGMGYAIAAAVTAPPDRLVVAVEGDSAFGFSGMEVETIVRYNLPIVVLVFNNGGVYGGDRRGDVEIEGPAKGDPAPTSFLPDCKYHVLMEAFGGKGYVCNTPAELAAACDEAFAAKKPALLNVIIDPFAGGESGRMHARN